MVVFAVKNNFLYKNCIRRFIFNIKILIHNVHDENLHDAVDADDADYYDYLDYLEEQEEQEKLWQEELERKELEERRNTCTCGASDSDDEEECIARVCKCICGQRRGMCRAWEHKCFCDHDFYGKCKALEHECVCGKTSLHDFCTSFCDYTSCSCPAARWEEMSCKLHKCQCPKRCIVDVHNCICETGFVGRCCAGENHSCSCEHFPASCLSSDVHICTCRHDVKKCLASERAHECTCLWEPTCCRCTEHICPDPEVEGNAPHCRTMQSVLELGVTYAIALNIHDCVVKKNYFTWRW